MGKGICLRIVSCLFTFFQASQDVISPGNRDRHRTGQKEATGGGQNKNAAWSESKPSGIDGLGPRLTNENRHPSVQVVRGSTNIDLSRAGEEDGATADRSNAPIGNYQKLRELSVNVISQFTICVNVISCFTIYVNVISRFTICVNVISRFTICVNMNSRIA